MTTTRVTVPVEPTEAMRLVPDRVLTETLYWMARAYERVHSMPRVSDTELANKIEAAKADLGRARDASPVLYNSAAPAPEGGAVTADALLRWIEENPHNASWQATAKDIREIVTALATREEAPAEAGEIGDALFRALRSYKLTNMACEDDPSIGYPLVDLMSNDGTDISTGEEEMRVLADHLSEALRAQPPAREDAQPVAKPAPFDQGGIGHAMYQAFNAYLADYVLSTDDADYEPTPFERDLIEDFFAGLMAEEAFFGPVRALYDTHPAPDALRAAVSDIAAERQRQVDVEGWSESHDDEHDDYQMARAAGCYAFHAGRVDDDDAGMFVNAAVRHGWPWDRVWWKPKSRRTDLVRAGALIVAEIERLDRAALQAEQKGGA